MIILFIYEKCSLPIRNDKSADGARATELANPVFTFTKRTMQLSTSIVVCCTLDKR